ncbi:MAG: hypothetical protein IJ941_00885, partial [Clostridia bacterium]|nr:hypothetical protein [Clostridia bacterium]
MYNINKVPLSKTQMGIYVENIAFPESTLYNIPLLGKLGEDISVERLKYAITKAGQAHPGLNTRIYMDENGEVLQQISDDTCIVDVIEMSDAEFAQRKERLVRPFALLGGKLYRFEIYITPSGNYWFQDIHHIIFDGAGLGILSGDIRRAYNGEEIETESYTGIDIALDEMQARQGEEYARAREYYGCLLNECEADVLPVRDVFDKTPRQGWLSHKFRMDEAAFKSFRKEEGISTTAFFTGVMGFLTAKYNYRDDSVIATIYNGRKTERTKNTLSMLVKTLPFVT